jgi:hypothetical protein
VALLVLVLACLLARPLAAHGRDTSHSRVRIVGERVEVALRVSGSDIARAGTSEVLAEHVRIVGADAACAREPSLSEQPLDGGDRVLRFAFDCSGRAGPRVVHIDVFDRLGPAHVHLLALDDQPEQVLSVSHRSVALERATTPGGGLLDFIAIGSMHVLEGLDHLAFLLALLLAAPSLARAAWLVTGFTLGHALSLALLALGLVQPHASAVELLIASSVLIVAAREHGLAARTPEHVAGLLALAAFAATLGGHVGALAAWGAALFAWGYLHRAQLARSEPLQPGLVVAFGLVHGAGFAGVLQQTSLPRDAELLALLGFNLGVELTALALVLLGWPALAWLRARGHEPRRPACLLLAALAGVWIVGRVLA